MHTVEWSMVGVVTSALNTAHIDKRIVIKVGSGMNTLHMGLVFVCSTHIDSLSSVYLFIWMQS